jgi:hypothetical protein
MATFKQVGFVSFIYCWNVCITSWLCYKIVKPHAGGMGMYIPTYLNLALSEGEWSASCFSCLYLLESVPQTSWIWLNPTFFLNVVQRVKLPSAKATVYEGAKVCGGQIPHILKLGTAWSDSCTSSFTLGMESLSIIGEETESTMSFTSVLLIQIPHPKLNP